MYMQVLRKLFSQQKNNFESWASCTSQDSLIIKCRSFVLKRLFMFILLSLPIQPSVADGFFTQVTNLIADQITNKNSELVNEIILIVSAKHHPYLLHPDFTNRAEDLDALYKLSDYHLLWLDSPQAEKNRLDALTLLENAPANGLTEAAYDAKSLLQKKPSVVSENYKQLAMYDTAISIALLRFLHDLHYGRVNPKDINFNLKLRDKKLIDLPVLIKTNLAQSTINKLPEVVEPKLKQYQKLKKALANYRLLVKTQPNFSMEFIKPIRPGENLLKADNLVHYLSALGDIAPDSRRVEKQSNRYTGELVEGVEKFQLRHGMNIDGVLGKATVEALNVPLTQRVTQIELAMERLRWLPEAMGSAGASIIVNIPAFQLWAFDDVNEINASMPNMRVVVGKASKNETPVLMAEMRFIDFMPYWNVPYNIVKKEILPKLIQNPDYLARENMELVATFDNEPASVVYNASTIAELKRGTLRIRQRPGNKNALGRVKFIFPNKNDVYMHDTPSHALFSRARRDFSHGCVRVANPDQLAEFVLKSQLSKEAIGEAMQTQKTRRVILKKSVPVLFFYMTSFIDQNDNVAFYSDIYGYDSVLQEALAKSVDVPDQEIFAPAPVLTPVESIKPDVDLM